MSSGKNYAGQAQGKAGECLDSAKGTANQARDKAAEAGSAAQQKAANAANATKEKTAEATGATQNKATNAADATKDKASYAADATKEKAQPQDQTPNFLQQKGEQVGGLAQGAIDGVKNTLGIGGQNNTTGKPGECLDSAKGTANQARDKAAEATSATQQKATNVANATKEKTAEATGATQKKATNATNATKEKASYAADATQEKAQPQDQTPNFFQQKGEQVGGLAQGAIDGVKNTLGMGDQKK